MLTAEVDALFDSVIPHFEIRVNVRFVCEPVAFDRYPIYMVYYLANRSQNPVVKKMSYDDGGDMENGRRRATLEDLGNQGDDETEEEVEDEAEDEAEDEIGSLAFKREEVAVNHG